MLAFSMVSAVFLRSSALRWTLGEALRKFCDNCHSTQLKQVSLVGLGTEISERKVQTAGASTVIGSFHANGATEIISHHVEDCREGSQTNWAEAFNGVCQKILKGLTENLGQFNATMDGSQ